MATKTDPPNGGGMFSYISKKFSKKNSHQYSKDKIVSVKLQFVKTNSTGHNKKRLFLVITYVKGFQVFDMNNPSNPKEIVNKKTTQPVEFAKIMDYPSKKFVTSSSHKKLLKKLPLLCYVTCDHRKDPLINFYSLRLHKNTDQISGFRESINQVLTSCELFMVVMKKRGYWYNPLTFEKIIHFHIFPNGGCALAERWVAYPSISIVRKREHILTASTDGAISDVAKKAARGIRIIKNFSSKTMTNMLGGESETAPSQEDQVNYSAFPNVGTVEVRDIYSKSVLCHFQAHTKTISMLEFDHSGTILVTTSVSGNHLNVYKIYPTHSDEEANVRLLHKLHRGITEARIRSIDFSINNRFVAVTSDHGTTHLFIIHPEGGKIHQDHHIQMTLPPSVEDTPSDCVKHAPVARIHHPGWITSENRYCVSVAFFTTRKNMEQMLVVTPSGNLSRYNIQPTRVTFQTEALNVQVGEDGQAKNLCRELDFRERRPVPIVWEDNEEQKKEKKKEESKRKKSSPYSFGGRAGTFGHEEEEEEENVGKVRVRRKSVDTLLIGNVEIETYRRLKKPIWAAGKFKFKTFTTYEKKEEDYLRGSMDLTQTVLVSSGPPRPLGIKDDAKHPMDDLSPSGNLGMGSDGEGKDGMDDQWEIIENDEYIPEVKSFGEVDEKTGKRKQKSKRELEYEKYLKYKLNEGEEEVPEYDRFRRNLRQAPQGGPDKNQYVYGTFKKAEDEKRKKEEEEEARMQEMRREKARLEFQRRQEMEKKKKEMMKDRKQNRFGYEGEEDDRRKHNIDQRGGSLKHRKLDPYDTSSSGGFDQDPRRRIGGDGDDDIYGRGRKKDDDRSKRQNDPYGYPTQKPKKINPYEYPSTTVDDKKKKKVGGGGYDFPSREPLRKTEGEPRLNSNPIFDDDEGEIKDVPEPVLGAAAAAALRRNNIDVDDDDKKKKTKKNQKSFGEDDDPYDPNKKIKKQQPEPKSDYVFSYPKIGGGIEDEGEIEDEEDDGFDPPPPTKVDNKPAFPGSGYRLDGKKKKPQQPEHQPQPIRKFGNDEEDDELTNLSDPSIQDYFAKQLEKSEIMKKEEQKKINDLFGNKGKATAAAGSGGGEEDDDDGIGALPNIPDIPSILPDRNEPEKNSVDDIMNMYRDKKKEDDGKKIQGSGGLMYPGMNFGNDDDDKKKKKGEEEKDKKKDNDDNFGIMEMESDDEDEGDSYFNDIMKQIQQKSDEKKDVGGDDDEEDDDEMWSV